MPFTTRHPLCAEDWCKQVRRSSLGLFALINPTSASIPRSVRTLVERDGLNLFASRTARIDALEVAPRLLTIPGNVDQKFTAIFVAQDAETPWAVLVSSSLSLPCLADRLRRRIDVTADGTDMMLRYWDSRVLLSLHRVLAETTSHRLFAFGKQALVSDRHGGCIALDLNCSDEDPVGTGRIALDRKDMLALAQASRIDAVLSLVRQGSPDALDAIADTDRYALAKSQSDACLERGLSVRAISEKSASRSGMFLAP